MTQSLSELQELQQLKAGGAGREAILDPTTNLEGFGLTLRNYGTGLAENVENLVFNTLDFMSPNADREAIYKKASSDVLQGLTGKAQIPIFGTEVSLPEPVEFAYEIAKKTFSDNDKEFETGIEKQRRQSQLKLREYKDKKELGAQFSSGGTGEFAAEIVAALPIMKFGRMSATNNALKNNTSAVNVARAVAYDTAENVALMGTTEFALAKAYGDTDKEAGEKAVMAGLFGAVGTPLVGVGKAGIKALQPTAKEAAQIKLDLGKPLSEEEQGLLAGGGKPTVNVNIPRKEMQDVRVEKGEELPSQKKVTTPEIKKFDKEFLDERGRQYSKSWLNSYQGKSTDKAANIRLPDEKISSPKEYEDSMKRSFKSFLDTVETYGGTDPKFKSKGSMTNTEKKLAEIEFQRDLLIKMSKRDEFGKVQKNRLLSKARTLEKGLEDLKAKMPKDIEAKMEAKFAQQKVEFKSPDAYNKEIKKQWEVKKSGHKQSYEGFGWHKDFDKLTPEQQQAKLLDTAKSKLDDKKFIEAIDKIETRIASKGKKFDIDNITDKQKYDNQDLYPDIENYINRKNDIELLESGEINQKEFAFREGKRLDAEFKKNPISGQKFESIEDLNNEIELREKAYSDIGIYKDIKSEVKKEKDGGDFIVDKKTPKDTPEKRASIRKLKLDAMKKYRTDGSLIRYKSGDRAGEPVLTKSEIRDIDEFGDVLTNDEILNKSVPNVPDVKKAEAIEEAKQIAKDKVRGRTKKKLGLDFSYLPKDIKFTQTIMDAKNSMGQIASVLTGSQKLADTVFVPKGEKELRSIVAEKMGTMFGKELGKSEIKTPFMIKSYGAGDKGIARDVMEENDWIKTEAHAYQFVDEFNKAFADASPAFDDLMTHIKTLHETRTNPIYEWTMPDGKKVKFDLRKYQSHIISEGKSKGVAFVRTDKVDKMSRALLPNIFHSIDGYIAREMKRKFKDNFGITIHTTHDAFHIPAGKEQVAEEIYRDILRDLNESNLMKDIFDQLGYKGWKKEGKLSDDTFSYQREFLGKEHEAGTIEKAEKIQLTSADKKIKAGKQMSEGEVMREFFATNSARNHEYFKMVDAMIDEAVISKANLGVATTSDDVYERALAFALQGNDFPRSNMIKPPKGSNVNEKVWYNEQTEIFNEFRAKAELNPDLKYTILGERKYFTEFNEPLNQTVKSKRQIKSQILKESFNSKSSGIDNIPSTDKDIYKESRKIEDKVKTNPRDITEQDLKVLEVEDNIKSSKLNIQQMEAMDSKDIKNTFIDKAEAVFKDVTFHIGEKFNDTKSYKQYAKIVGIVENPQKHAESAGENVAKYVDDLLKGEDQDEWTRMLFETDARAIKEFKNRAEAKQFFNDNILIYERAKPSIDQIAKAIGREEEQVGAFLNNATAVAKHYNIPKRNIDIIDKLISIKAMEQNKAWDFYEKHYGTDRFNTLMDIADTQYARSTSLFLHSNAIHKQVKGFISEYYDGGKQITDDGRVIYDAETKEESGVLVRDLTQNKVGKLQEEEIDYSKYDSQEALFNFALKNRLKITDKGFRKIPTAEIKDAAGRQNTLSARLGATEAGIEKKIAHYNSIVKILTDEGAYDELFSKVPKDGFIAVDKDTIQKMPYLMQGEANYINRNYADQLLGRKEFRLVKENADQSAKIADKLMQNLVTNFKNNVVLKNAASYKNALLVNFATNALIDANVLRATRNAKKAASVFNEYSQLSREYDIAKATGKNLDEAKAKLERNEIQKYLDLGLSINTLDGVKSESSLLSNMASDLTGNKLDKIANEVLMNQRGNTGNITKHVFSFIDFQGRYMAIKSLEAKGLSPADAVRRSNDLFGQMDHMAPVFVSAIDKYGAFVFSKWFMSVAPAIAKASKNNPEKAIALTAGLYFLSDETDIMLSNISPIEGAIDMAEGGLTGDGFVWDKKLQPFILPNIYKDFYKTMQYNMDETQHWHDAPAILWKNRLEKYTTKDGETVDYRGPLQKIIEG